MATANGYILILSENRYNLFVENAEEEDRFAQPVPEFKHSRNAPLLCFILTQNMQITHIAFAKRGIRAGTDLDRLNLKDIQTLESPVAVASIKENIPKRLRRWTGRLDSGGLLSHKMFQAVVDAIVSLLPSLASFLCRFTTTRAEQIAALPREIREALASQKLAVATAMSMADLPREALLEWNPPDQGVTPTSFLDGLSEIYLREDAMIMCDLNTLPGYELIKQSIGPAAVFKSEKCRLTVVLANKLPLEEQTGVDLIYFNETFRSFVMIQYKAMEQENDKMVFRLPNAQLMLEIERMHALRDKLVQYTAGLTKDDFRFSDNPFFLKLCPRIVFNPDDVSLIPGMYIPLDYWERLSTDSSIVGPRGGKAISYSNVGRYFDNTEFITLVEKAWVGTTASQSEFLCPLIRAVVTSSRTVVIGIKTDLQPSQSTATTSEEEDNDEPEIDGRIR